MCRKDGTWRRIKRIFLTGVSGLALIGGMGTTAHASSHSDAPLIKQDPQANLTDVYAFIGKKYGDPNTKVLNIVVNVHPFIEPGDGVIYDRFADDALYSIHIANPLTGESLLQYNFKFSISNPTSLPGLKNPNTILSYGLGTQLGGIQQIGDGHQNYTQFYTVTKQVGNTFTVINPPSGMTVAPPNTGKRATPLYNDSDGRAISGATTEAALDPYTKQAIHTLKNGNIVFAGMREDSFFADAPGIFDLLDPRILGSSLGQGGGGVDGFKGFNVLTYAIQIPVSELPSFAYKNAFGGSQTGVGVYASVSRPRYTLRTSTDSPAPIGPWVQVNRLANPLFNEVLVALKDKDRYNRMSPTDDIANFKTYAQTPELPVLLNTVFGTNFQTHDRADLVAIYIPDVIRVDTTTEPVKLEGQTGFNRLGFIGGDTTANGTPSGWPNGRRFGDDVVDIALTAVASGPTFSTVTVVGDNVPANDQMYNQVFPYAATPNSGTRNSKDSGINVGF